MTERADNQQVGLIRQQVLNTPVLLEIIVMFTTTRENSLHM